MKYLVLIIPSMLLIAYVLLVLVAAVLIFLYDFNEKKSQKFIDKATNNTYFNYCNQLCSWE